MTDSITGSMNLHRVLSVELAAYTPDNANAVTIAIKSHDGYSDFDLTIFDLPTKHAERLASALMALHEPAEAEPA